MEKVMDENIEKFENEEITETTPTDGNDSADISTEKLGATENGDAVAETEKSEEIIETEKSSESADTEKSEKDAEEVLPEKTEIIGVRFKKEGKTYYFAPNGLSLKKDDKVIVDTSRGAEYGFVTIPNSAFKTSELVMPLRDVIRVATEEDNRTHAENTKREIEAYNTCIALIDEHGLKMKLIDVECAFDRSKLLFYFSAEERVDFREIVKSLATAFHTRIEMRQIGIRDEAKMLGGLGVCGRPFCCSSFLTDFVQVSVKMAKEQNISLNAAKISGACGKLMCCLRYEYDTYLAEKALTPKVGSRVMTPDGLGEVTESNPLAGIVKVRLDGKADDAEQTVYVREDVVKEEEYGGEALTKTELPKRGKSKEEEDIFASFASVINGSVSPSDEAKGESDKKDNATQSQAKDARNAENAVGEKRRADAQGGGKEEPSENGLENTVSEGANGGGNKRHRKKKHKGHHGGGNQGGGHGGNPSGNQIAGNGGRGQGGELPRQQDGQNQNGSRNQTQGQNKGQSQGGKNDRGGYGHGKRRHFRSRNKNRGDGGAKDGQ